MTSEVGSGQVAIFPTFKGFRGAVTKETEGSAKAASSIFGRVLGSAGAKSGATAGKGFKGAFNAGAAGVGAAPLKKLQADVAATSRAVNAARLKEQDAAGKARVAEAALTEARQKNVAGSARLVAAEEKAAAAARGLTAAQDNTRDASARLSAAQARVKASSDEAGSAVARSGRSFRGAGTALGGLASQAGKAAKVLGTGLAVAGAVAGIALLGRGVRALTGYIGESVKTAAGWQVLNSQSAAVIRSTGGAAQVTAKHVGALSQSLENQTATEAEAIQKGANLLLTFTGIRNEAGKGNKIFDRTTATAVDMAKALGIDVSAAAMQLGKALNDPAKGLTKLQRSGVTFTDQQKKQVVALVASGKTLEAQKIILGELNKEFGGSGVAYAKTYEGALYRIKDAAGDFGASILSKALPGITKLLDTGADLINWAGGTNRVKSAAQGLGDAVGRIASKASDLSAAFKGKNPLEDAFKIVLPKVDFGQFVGGVKSALSNVKPLFETFGSYVKNIVPAIGDTFKVLGPALGDAFKDLGPTLRDTLPSLGSAVKDLLPAAVSLLKALAPLIPPIAEIIKNLAPTVKVLADGLSFLIKNGLQPLVETQAGITGVFKALSDGATPAQIALGGLSGKFGPVLQVVGRFAASVGTNIKAAIDWFKSFATSVGTFIGRAAAVTASGISRALSFFGRLGQVPGIATRAIGSFVSTIAAGLGRAVSAIGSGIGRAVSTIGQLPGRAAAVLGSLGNRLFSSGAALIQGFINGIASKIKDISGTAARAVAEAAKYFPHSPAKKGAFSGRGWTLFSGQALAVGFANGIEQKTRRIAAASDMATRAARISSTVSTTTLRTAGQGSTGGQGGSFVGNLYLDSGEFLGKVRGEVQNGFVQYTDSLNTASRLGKQPATFV